MFKQSKKIVLGIAALVALALGGATLAQAGNAPVKPAQAPAQSENATGPDTDSVQSGDQTTPDATSSQAESTTGPDTDNVQSGDQTTPDVADAASSSSESGEKAGSETAADDGPGGHADEPGNAAADHQFEGKE